ncbi:tetratricopeptide repeat protein [Mesoterricola silvestris]|uniref:tetratricopeptide repeat protein n=1 Tax=Mesoterricola silvestris TaxID=2927979 RepID=UPI002930486C|nr:tetratricopeptide repeat protein [Mesoterricola silvestris]
MIGTDASARRRWFTALMCAGLLASVWIVYFQVRTFQFVNFDDLVYVTRNPQVLKGLSWETVAWAFRTGAAANWHPVTWLSHLADVSMFGADPGWHHLVSVVFHTAGTMLVFLGLRSMTGDPWPSWFVAILFAVHPVHVESVAWVSERKDVLSTVFMLLTIWAYVRGLENRRMRWAAVILYGLGLMAKPMLVTLPILLLILDRWPLGRNGSLRARLREKVPYFALAAGSSLVTFVVQRYGGAVATLESVPLPVRAGNALIAYVKYLGKMVWPVSLAPFYPLRAVDIAPWKVLAALALLVGITVAACRLRERRPYLLAGWLWYLVALVPVIGLVQVGSQSMADRYTYIPLLGPFVMVVWGLRDAASRGRIRPWVVALAGGCATVMLMGRAHGQVGFWRDSLTLFTHARRVTVDNAVARTNQGQALLVAGRLDEALPEFRASIAMAPRARIPRFLLSRALVQLGRREEAAACLKGLLESTPGDSEALRELALLFLDMGRLQEAAFCYREYLSKERPRTDGELDPYFQADRDQDARLRLGFLYRRLGQHAEAITCFLAATQSNPSDPAPLFNLGLSLSAVGRDTEALACFRRCAVLAPRQVQVRLQLAASLKKAGALEEAGAECRKVLEIQPGNGEAQRLMGTLHKP